MKIRWFRPFGWIYLPISWQGFLMVFVTLIFCIQVFIAVDKTSHSVSDTFYGIFPFVVPSLGILYWIASKSTDSKK